MFNIDQENILMLLNFSTFPRKLGKYADANKLQCIFMVEKQDAGMEGRRRKKNQMTGLASAVTQ